MHLGVTGLNVAEWAVPRLSSPFRLAVLHSQLKTFCEVAVYDGAIG